MAEGPRALVPVDRMDPVDFGKLYDDFVEAAAHSSGPAAVLGYNTTAGQLLQRLDVTIRQRIQGIFDDMQAPGGRAFGLPLLPFEMLREKEYGILVVAANRDKERILEAATLHVRGTPTVLVSGYGHYDFQDQDFHQILSTLTVPSLANGYENTRPHLYQCLRNAAQLGLKGAIAEFGCFQGGTTMFLARAAARLGQAWPIYAFDTFRGFPARRNLWDMYDHEDLSQNDLRAVRDYLAGENVEIIPGDIVETASVLNGQPMVLSFIDTDNYTPAMAALDAVQESTVVGGAIVFDHFTGFNRFRYTLGERRAAKRLLDDPRYFNLHGTGVFFRQR